MFNQQISNIDLIKLGWRRFVSELYWDGQYNLTQQRTRTTSWKMKLLPHTISRDTLYPNLPENKYVVIHDAIVTATLFKYCSNLPSLEEIPHTTSRHHCGDTTHAQKGNINPLFKHEGVRKKHWKFSPLHWYMDHTLSFPTTSWTIYYPYNTPVTAELRFASPRLAPRLHGSYPKR